MSAPSMWFNSVRRKLFAGVVLTTLVALFVSGGSLFLYDLHSYRQSNSTDLAIQAELLGYSTTAALEFDDRAVAQQNLDFLKARPSIRRAAIYNARGELFASYVRTGLSASELPAHPSEAGIAIAGNRIAVFRPIAADGDVIGSVYVYADLGLYNRIGSYSIIALAVTLAALAVSVLFSSWLQRAITRPIVDIARVAREVVETRDYAVRAKKTTQDETGTLVDAFNEMLSEIERRTAALESSGEEIRRLNKDLERRVGERTAQLEQTNRQLHTANLAKSSFLSTMSHEIRTPMNGVLGMLELLSLTRLDSEQRTTLEVVRNSGRSLLRIIDDILDFSKIEAGKLEIRPEAASIDALVTGVVGIYSGNASSKSLLLTSQVDSRLSPAVQVDPLRLQQILNNLVSNAIKFTAKGFVEIRARLLERRDGTDIVQFSVTDTGMGIPPEAQKQLFQPFAQAGVGVTGLFGGTGLGLSICQRLANLMGSSIDIESQVGRGTTMSLTLALPIADPAALPRTGDKGRHDVAEKVRTRREPPSVEDAEKEGTLVLVVDDHPINRLVLARQVTALGYANEAAEDGGKALELWKSGRFAMVITDCNMPEIDGYDLARAVRARERETGMARTLIIACTANALRGDADKCFAAGMDDYIAKPVVLSELMGKLDHWLPIPGGGARSPGEGGSASAPAAVADPSPIDRSVVAEVSGGDAAFERELYERFLRALGEDVSQFLQAVSDHEISLVAQKAHRIKGASRSVGAHPMATVSAGIEAAALRNDWDAVMEALGAFRREAARLNRYFEFLAQAQGAAPAQPS